MLSTIGKESPQYSSAFRVSFSTGTYNKLPDEWHMEKLSLYPVSGLFSNLRSFCP